MTAGARIGAAALVAALGARACSSRPSRSRIRSATSRSTTSRRCASRRTRSRSTSSSTAPRSRRSRSGSASTSTAMATLQRRRARRPSARPPARRSRPISGLAVGGSRLAPTVVAAGLTFPPGAGGLPTMRLVCEYAAALAGADRARRPRSPSRTASFAERIGWREIVVLGDGTSVAAADATAVDPAGVSNRLTSYPAGSADASRSTCARLRSSVTPGGPMLAAWSAPDAQAVVAPAQAAGDGSAAGSGQRPSGRSPRCPAGSARTSPRSST